ncbi:MAG: type 4a pilus biogenesis protein PilO [Planctomycetes bacterium]|nr:type 4a pilus biogenesis protein PilO [Planctomycetota bacterium]
MEIVEEKKQIMTFVMVVAMAVAFFLFKYVPLRKKLSDVKQNLSEQRLTIMKSETEKQQIPIVQALLDDLNERTQNFDVQIPGDRELGVFLKQVTQIMNKYGLKEQNIKPNSEVKTGNVNCIPIEMQCKGTLRQLFDFYKTFQNAGRLVRIQEVSFTNERDYTGQLSMRAKAIIYYSNQQNEG